MLADNVPYRFHVRSDTPVLTHTTDQSYNLKRGFLATNTEIPVVYHLPDLLFVPADFTYETLMTAVDHSPGSGIRTRVLEKLLEHNKASEDQAWLSHILKYFYGFVLPENKRNIDVILVRENDVVTHSRDGNVIKSKIEDSNIQRQKKMIRNVKHQKGHLW